VHAVWWGVGKVQVLQGSQPRHSRINQSGLTALRHDAAERTPCPAAANSNPLPNLIHSLGACSDTLCCKLQIRSVAHPTCIHLLSTFSSLFHPLPLCVTCVFATTQESLNTAQTSTHQP
jgi:hypothetical protein